MLIYIYVLAAKGNYLFCLLGLYCFILIKNRGFVIIELIEWFLLDAVLYFYHIFVDRISLQISLLQIC